MIKGAFLLLKFDNNTMFILNNNNSLWYRDLPGATPHTSVNGERAYTVRNYTIVGNYKVGFPQWRVMRCHYPDHGHPLLRTGDEVFVLGRSQKRGFLIIEHSGRQIHLPHNYTELRVCIYVLARAGIKLNFFVLVVAWLWYYTFNVVSLNFQCS